MDREHLKHYLTGRYQGHQSFLQEIVFPIFGKENFEDNYQTELLEAQPEVQLLAEQTGIKSIKNIGQIEIGINLLLIFDITVSDSVLMERNRVNIQRVIRRVMESFSSAFMVFHYDDVSRWDWRFSYCQKGVSDKDSSDNKRYTFLLGPGQSCRTAIDNFIKLAEKNQDIEVEDIKSAFDVEALSKEFFTKYKEQYEKFVCYITGKKYEKKGSKYEEKTIHKPHETMYEAFGCDDKLVRDYIKQMLGRITFLHFVQKKGWLGVPEGQEWGEGDQQFMLHLYEYANEEQRSDFLDLVLEPLFDKALDSDRSNDGDIFDTAVLLPNGSKVRIPYLNGGLFERNSLDEIDTKFPAEYFKDLLTFFYQYNFTIDENDPNEAQVGIDPEMLGRIFENLLEDNKDKGAFYTPKEIVRYMCRQSLIAYLQTDIADDEEKIVLDKFVNTYDVALIGGEESELAKRIDKLLKEVKICDPAIGSGAFPMGLLKELFMCRGAIEHFDNAADIKRHIIQQNIYGVDIERGAVDIARLRFWLSLIVDETAPTTLPNLDFKIMQGNSLLENYCGIDLSKLVSQDTNITFYEPQRNLFGEIEDTQMKISFAKTENLSEFQENVRRYYSVNSHSERQHLKDKIESFVRDAVLSTLEGRIESNNIKRGSIDQGENLSTKQRAAIEAIDKENTILSAQFETMKELSIVNNQFFLWHTWFNDVFSRPSKEGFDIIIGNPPYISTKGVTLQDKALYEKEFGFSDDTYNLFTFKGIDLCKNAGTLTFIIPKTFWTTQTKRNMRDLILSNQINYIFDTANPFEAAMVDTCIMQVKKVKPSAEHQIRFLDGTNSLSTPVVYEPILQKKYINSQNSVIFKPTDLNLRIYELYGEKVKALYDKWWDKIKTSRDIEKNKEELERYRKSLKPGDIALLGCLTEGGQGLATANNGKYIAVRRSTKWSKNIVDSRPKKLAEAIKKQKRIESEFAIDPQIWLQNANEEEIAQKFDSLKEKYGRDIFGQGYIYRIIEDNQIADVDSLSEDEKQNGIDTSKNYYVPYDKGDKDGNRWYLETPFAIAWSKENVHFLKTDPKARYQGYSFYFREGFCWIDVNSTYLKARLKANGVFDVLSMSLFTMTQIPDWYYVSMINSSFVSEYVDVFINNTSHFQINDARQLPIIIPSRNDLAIIKGLFEEALVVKSEEISSTDTKSKIEEKLSNIQKRIDNFVERLYLI